MTKLPVETDFEALAFGLGPKISFNGQVTFVSPFENEKKILKIPEFQIKLEKMVKFEKKLQNFC